MLREGRASGSIEALGCQAAVFRAPGRDDPIVADEPTAVLFIVAMSDATIRIGHARFELDRFDSLRIDGVPDPLEITHGTMHAPRPVLVRVDERTGGYPCKTAE